MQSKGGYDEVVEVPEDVTPTGQFVVSVKITILLQYPCLPFSPSLPRVTIITSDTGHL